MALIGTISGSVGAGGSLVSATAISGTLIIADAPPSSFPAIQSGVKLFVSGNKTELGADTPNAIFGGDTFVSGAFGTDSYIQMKPVTTLLIPTNTTASYIYTSGSTNDLYFTQYQPGTGYTNTTRLRWLEGMLTTGLLHGGVLSTANGTTTFSITSGSGIILSYNATLTTDPYPTINYVSWPAYVSQSLTYVTSSLLTYIGINPSGGIIQQTSPFSTSTDSDYITIGRVLHQSGSVTNGTITQPIVSYGTNHWQDDFSRAFGPLKVSGHILAASGSTLGLTKTAGDSYVIGRNYTTDPNNPNNVTSTTDTAVTVSKIYRAYVSGSTLRLDTGVANAGYTDINPTQYNNNGTLASVGAANASIQRVYWYPNSVSRAYTVYYGSDTYSDPPGSGQNALDVAQQNIAAEPFVEGENTAGAAILVGYILVLGSATNLSNTAQARFIQAGISRGAGAGGGGGVAVGATTPGGLDTYVQFNDGGSTFGGDAGLTYNKTTDTLTVAGDIAVDGGDITTSATTFNLVNATATTVNLGGGASAINIGAGGSATTFAGNVTGSNALLSGDIAVNGGDITTTAATFNIIDSTATSVNFARAATALVAGASGGSTTFQGNITGSNALVSGDLAVDGGDITTAAATFNLITGSATTVNFAGAATALTMGANGTGATTIRNVITASAGKIALTNGAGSSISFPVGAGALGPPTFTNSSIGSRLLLYPSVGASSADWAIGMESQAMWFGVNVATATPRFKWYAGTTEIASLRGDGLFTVTGSLATSTGNIIGAPGAGTNVMTLISSGNIIARLDTDGSADGHKFAVQDWRNIDQFSVGENGNAELSGSLVISGSTLLGTTTERLLTTVGGTGTVTFDMTFNSIFYVNGPSGDITANFTSVPNANNRVLTPTVILSQSATPRTITAVQVNGTGTPILWANGTTPTATANKQDVFGFSLIRSGSIWTVLGQLSTYG